MVNSAAPARIFMFEGDQVTPAIALPSRARSNKRGGAQEFVERLIAKHGPEAYVKMARDTRLNPFQVRRLHPVTDRGCCSVIGRCTLLSVTFL